MKVASAFFSLAIALKANQSFAGRIGGAVMRFDEDTNRSLSGRKTKKMTKGSKGSKAPKGPVTYEPGKKRENNLADIFDLLCVQ